MEEEIWKTVKTVNSTKYGKRVFEVSSEGNVRLNGKIIELSNFRETPYYADPTGTEHLLHRLIAKLFIPNPENKPCVDHINCNKHDNRAVNLRWVTYSENMLNPITREHNKKALLEYYKHNESPMKGKKHTPEHTKNQSAAQLGRIPWNKGLTDLPSSWNKGQSKETNKSLKQLGENVSKTKRKKFASGDLVIYNKGTKYMNNGVTGLWVNPEEIDKYIQLGYKFGYLK